MSRARLTDRRISTMKPKAYEDEIIQEIREKRRNGAKIMELAKEYFVCEATMVNYCKGIRREKKMTNNCTK
jgi:hypothetical protein